MCINKWGEVGGGVIGNGNERGGAEAEGYKEGRGHPYPQIGGQGGRGEKL